jgi:hypothetical protein
MSATNTKSTPLSQLGSQAEPSLEIEEDEELVKDILNQINTSSKSVTNVEPSYNTISYIQPKQTPPPMQIPSFENAVLTQLGSELKSSNSNNSWFNNHYNELKDAAFIITAVSIVHYIPTNKLLESFLGGRTISPMHKVISRAILTAGIALMLKRSFS